MLSFRFTYVAIVPVVLLIFLSFNIAKCDVPLDTTSSESVIDPTETKISHVDKSAPNEHTGSSKSTTTSTKETVRMITKEELELHDGKQKPTYWLSILSQVFDVSAGPEYYSEEGTYRVFVARDANVPFITGNFSREEAARPLSSLETHELYSLNEWLKFYVDEDRYPFVGLLVGDLYDKDGNPTEEKKLLDDRIAGAHEEAAIRRKKTAEIIARRKVEDEARKKEKQRLIEELKMKDKEQKWNRLAVKVISSVRQFFQGTKEPVGVTVENEL